MRVYEGFLAWPSTVSGVVSGTIPASVSSSIFRRVMVMVVVIGYGYWLLDI